MGTLAIHGGSPVCDTLIPYARQSINEEDIQAVVDVLHSDWLTTGPMVQEFEKAFAGLVDTKEAVAVNNGTAALHTALFSAGIQPGDEVIVPTMTFAATANAVAFLGATPIFADSDAKTLLINPQDVETKITEKTKAILAVDYAGQPCDYESLEQIANKHDLLLLADACHALGATYNGKNVGSLAQMSTFSFHPVKPIATGEGGMITTNDSDLAKRMRHFRNHCLSTDHRERQEQGSWFYEMTDLGYNYRLSDIHCALGLSQLKHVKKWTERRQVIAKKYDEAFSGMPAVKPLEKREDCTNAYHLYVIRLELEQLSVDRNEIFRALRAENIGVNVHYIPVHLHPYYRTKFGTVPGMCPVAESAYEGILSLPMFSNMTDDNCDDVITAVEKVCTHYAQS